MGKFIIGVLILLVLFVLILIIRTITYKFGKSEKSEDRINIEKINTFPSEKSVERFAGGVRIPTISNIVYEETDFKPFDDFKEYLPTVYPEVYKTMDTATVNKYGLIFHWKGKNSNLKPILFLSHYDVVPVTGYKQSENINSEYVFQLFNDPSTPIDSISTEWDYEPFSGAVTNGRIYGRGTLDMKGMLFSLMESADTLIAEGFQPERDIWFAFGHDEEVSGLHGALKIAEYFKEKGLTFEAVYDEGGVIAAPGSAMESIKEPLALIGIGEKGYLSLRIKVYGLGGHSSMPPAKSSLVYAAEIVEKLNNNQMPAQIITPIASFLDNVGGGMDFTSRMAIANQWLLKPLLLSNFSKSPTSNALVRTTTAISMAKGSDAPNVLASVAEITVNFRILPGDSIADVMAHVKELCKDYKVEIETISEREASGISPENVKGFEIIKEKNISTIPGSNYYFIYHNRWN